MHPIVVSTSPTPNKNINPGPILLTGELTSLVAQAHEVGADGIELRCVPEDLGTVDKIVDIVGDAGLIVSGISTGRLSREGGHVLSSYDEASRRAAADALCRIIDIAAPLGAQVLVGSAKGQQEDDEPLSAYTDRLAATLAPVNSYGKEVGVRIEIEAINRYEINALTTGAATATFVEDYGLDNCFVHLDAFHMNIEEEDLPGSIRDVGHRLGYFQFADSNRLWPGGGHIDFAPIVEALEEVGYDGVWSLEYQPFPDGVTAAKNGVRFLRENYAHLVN